MNEIRRKYECECEDFMNIMEPNFKDIRFLEHVCQVQDCPTRNDKTKYCLWAINEEGTHHIVMENESKGAKFIYLPPKKDEDEIAA